MGTLWWFITMLTYAPNQTYLETTAGVAQEPIIWLWANLGNSKNGWTAAAYLSTFLVYASVSVVELFGWSFWAIDNPGSDCFYYQYVTTVGYWLELYGGILTWLFAVLQLVLPNTGQAGPGLGGVIDTEFGNNCIFLIVGNGLMWIVTSLLHIIYVPELRDELPHCSGKDVSKNSKIGSSKLGKGDKKSTSKRQRGNKKGTDKKFTNDTGLKIDETEDFGDWRAL